MARSDLRHGSICATLRPNLPAVSSLAGDDSRLKDPGAARLSGILPRTWAKSSFSPFVLGCHDSESDDADPPRASLALPNRLAPNQPDRALHPRAGSVRALPSPAWPLRRAARHRRGMVGSGRTGVVRQSRSAIAEAARVRATGAHPHHAQARLFGCRAPQPRSDLQWTGVAKSRGAVSTLPYDTRRGGASPAPLVERFPPPRARRPLLGPLSLALGRRPMSSSIECSLGVRLRTCGTSSASSQRRDLGTPAGGYKSKRSLRGEDAAAPSIDPIGGNNDRSPSGSQDDYHGAATARR